MRRPTILLSIVAGRRRGVERRPHVPDLDGLVPIAAPALMVAGAGAWRLRRR